MDIKQILQELKDNGYAGMRGGGGDGRVFGQRRRARIRRRGSGAAQAAFAVRQDKGEQRDYRGGGHGGRAGERGRRAYGQAGYRGAHERRLRGELRRAFGAAYHAELLRERGRRGEHRQRVRRGLLSEQYKQAQRKKVKIVVNNRYYSSKMPSSISSIFEIAI